MYAVFNQLCFNKENLHILLQRDIDFDQNLGPSLKKIDKWSLRKGKESVHLNSSSSLNELIESVPFY
jgi:hypothetical protein